MQPLDGVSSTKEDISTRNQINAKWHGHVIELIVKSRYRELLPKIGSIFLIGAAVLVYFGFSWTASVIGALGLFLCIKGRLKKLLLTDVDTAFSVYAEKMTKGAQVHSQRLIRNDQEFELDIKTATLNKDILKIHRYTPQTL